MNHIRKVHPQRDRRIGALRAPTVGETLCGDPITDHDLPFREGRKVVIMKNGPVCEKCAAKLDSVERSETAR